MYFKNRVNTTIKNIHVVYTFIVNLVTWDIWNRLKRGEIRYNRMRYNSKFKDIILGMIVKKPFLAIKMYRGLVRLFCTNNYSEMFFLVSVPIDANKLFFMY